jgi:hypothetical protein
MDLHIKATKDMHMLKECVKFNAGYITSSMELISDV